ncbi:thioredoxin-like protein [Pelagophyceae sp. CCMP2097]|nr:thioredoxin-like protein [Pelagophyceae sp. CCMP2097]
MPLCIGPVCFPDMAVWSLLVFVAKLAWDKLSVLLYTSGILKGVSAAAQGALDARPEADLPEVAHVDSRAAWDAMLASSAKTGRPLVVDFTATWCGPCQKVKPFFRRLAATYAASADFVVVDVDDLEDVAELAKVAAMPTFQVWAGAAIADAVTGSDEAKLQALVEKHVNKKFK